MVDKNIVKWCAETLLSSNSPIYGVIQVLHLQLGNQPRPRLLFHLPATKLDAPMQWARCAVTGMPCARGACPRSGGHTPIDLQEYIYCLVVA